MKLQFVLLLSSLASSVFASREAGPYQTVYAWYAYQMEVEFYGPLNTITAFGCPGSGPGGNCYFDEFIKWIQKRGQNTPAFQGDTTIGTDLTPDVEFARNELNRVGYNNAVEPSRLLPTIFEYNPGRGPTFSELYDPIMKNIQDTRQAMKDANIDESTSEPLAKARQAMTGIVEGRRKEYFAGQIAAFQQMILEELPQGGAFVDLVKVETMANGEVYQELDFDGMLSFNKDNPAVLANLRNKISEFPAWYASQTPKDSSEIPGVSHFNAINSCTSYAGALNDPVVCS